VCGGSSSTRTLTVGEHTLNRCAGCVSLFYEADKPIPKDSGDAFDLAGWKHYVQIGAGIDAMLMPLLALPREGARSLLDVGCGFGFLVDYWSRMLGGEAVGVEISPYGAIGARRLGITVHREPLSHCVALKGKTFDVVYSSEVIEHVADPGTFVRELRSAMSPQGSLILTTPAAAFVSPDREPRDRARLLAALSPGSHRFLLSREALRTLLLEAGFASVHVVENEDHIYAWASARELPQPRLPDGVHPQYLDYLRSLALSADKNVAGGALYRLFKELVCAGRVVEADGVFVQLDDFAASAYGIRLDSPNVRQATATRSLAEHIASYPAWLGCSLYFAGILLANHRGDLRGKLRAFEASVSLLRHEIRLAPTLAQERSALLPVAEFHFRQALIHNLRYELAPALDPTVADSLRQRFTDEMQTLVEDFRPRAGKGGDAIEKDSGSDPDRLGF
jgi:SAM-dependent methyltransferase